MRKERGFTLIEVVVAFAIFALSAGAIYGLLSSAARRTMQADEREAALLAAQSLLSQLRLQTAPWPEAQSGTTATGLAWRILSKPSAIKISERSTWRAVEVTVSVHDERHPAREYSLKSVELAHKNASDES